MHDTHPWGAARFITTTLRRSILLGLVLQTPALGAELPSEVELVRGFFAGDVAQSDLEAAELRARALGTPRQHVAWPELEARHEEVGEAGITNVVGGAVSLDLGFGALPERRAASLRGEAGQLRLRADAFGAVCALRREALALWATSEITSDAQESQERLERLLSHLDAQAEAGEVASFDRDRASLSVLTRTVSTTEVRGDLAVLQQRLEAWTARPVPGVVLAPLSLLPTLEQALEQAQGDNPDLLALRLERDAAARSRAASRRAALPDLRLSAGARWDSVSGSEPAQGYEVGGALELPVLGGARLEARDATASYAEAQARLARGEAELRAQVQGAWQRASSVRAPRPAADSEAVWTVALARYEAGEDSIEALLQLAEVVDAAARAEVQAERLQRSAHLDLACAIGRFPEPSIQSTVEESLP